MALLVYIVVLIFETIYYSLFMRYSRNESKLWKYLLLFSLINTFFFFVTTDMIFSYMLLVLMILYGLKYIVNIKISLYDIFFIFVMMLLKLLIEIIIALPISIIINSIDIAKILVGIIKCVIVFSIRYHLNTLYVKLHKYWNENKFFIRYTFTILMFLYVIFSCVFLIKYR